VNRRGKLKTSSRLRAVAGGKKGGAGSGPPPPPIPQKHAESTVEQIDRVTRTLLRKLQRHAVPDPEGRLDKRGFRRSKMKDIEIDPPRARAICEVLRLRLELFDRFEVEEKLQTQKAELLTLMAEMQRLKKLRGVEP
jgi:hypothetical protein